MPMWKRTDEEPYTSTPNPNPSPATPAPGRGAEPRRSGTPAVIGESIRVDGEIHGDGDLIIEGEVDGKVHLAKNSVTVGRSGRVKADIHGGVLVVEGKVQGNLFADERVVVKASGEVRGNITSPRVSLEDGSQFKGSIDMEPRASAGGGNRDKDRGSRPGGGGSSPERAGGGEAGESGKPGGGASGGGGGGSASGGSSGGSGGGGGDKTGGGSGKP